MFTELMHITMYDNILFLLPLP